jgi:hypothetical protein
MEHLRHQIKTKNKTLLTMQGIPIKTEKHKHLTSPPTNRN